MAFNPVPSLITGVESGIAKAFGVGGQSFSTIPVPNDLLALYTLSIRAPGTAKQAVTTYTFPITPSSLVKEYVSMAAMYDVKGSPGQNGVQRVIDEYGNAPPIWTLEGTTGWQRHSADGQNLAGIDSIAQLQQLLAHYAQFNQSQAANNNPHLYTLEFHDYFSGDYWQVEPIGRQAISQVSNQPLLFRYSFRWAGIVSLAAAIPTIIDSPLRTLLDTPVGRAITTLGSSLTSTISNYTAETAGSLVAEL